MDNFDMTSVEYCVEVSIDRALKKVYLLMYSELNRVGKMWWIWFRERMDEPKHGRMYPLPEHRGRYGYRGKIYKMPRVVWAMNESGQVRPTQVVGPDGNPIIDDAYIASAEGEYPATVTGDLLENLTFKIKEKKMSTGAVAKGAVLTLVITSGVSYSSELEQMERKLVYDSIQEFWYGLGMDYVKLMLKQRIK